MKQTSDWPFELGALFLALEEHTLFAVGDTVS